MNATNTKIEAATLHSAMALAFAKIEGATKTTTGQVGQQKYKYADLGSVIEAIKPALIEHGLFFTQHPFPSPDGVTVETVLHHESGESISLGSLYVPANKRDPQGFGSALTYARRYGLQTGFGVPTEDDDGNAAMRAGPEARAQSGLIDDDQWATLTQLMMASGVTADRVAKRFNVPSVKQLPANKFEEAKDLLTEKIKRAPYKAEELAK